MLGLGESTVTLLTQHIQTQKPVFFFGRLPLFFFMTLNITQYLALTDHFLRVGSTGDETLQRQINKDLTIRTRNKTYQVSKYLHCHGNITQSWQLLGLSLLVKVQNAYILNGSLEPGYCKIRLARQSPPVRTYIIFLRYSQGEALTSGKKGNFFTPALSEVKPGGWSEDASHHNTHPALRWGKPGSRSPLEEQAMCPLKYPWSYLRSCRPDCVPAAFYRTVFSLRTDHRAGRAGDLREKFNPGEF